MISLSKKVVVQSEPRHRIKDITPEYYWIFIVSFKAISYSEQITAIRKSISFSFYTYQYKNKISWRLVFSEWSNVNKIIIRLFFICFCDIQSFQNLLLWIHEITCEQKLCFLFLYFSKHNHLRQMKQKATYLGI